MGYIRYCCSKQEPTKSVRLIFKRTELFYDIENYSFVEGDIMEPDNIHAQHQVFDIGQSGNKDRVTRVLNLAHSECVEMLYPYTKKELAEVSFPYDDILAEPEEYIIDLTVPQSFSQTTIDLLRHLIHEYLVYRVLSDWFSITNPKSMANWERKIELVKQKIQTSILSRTGRIRRKLKPF